MAHLFTLADWLQHGALQEDGEDGMAAAGLQVKRRGSCTQHHSHGGANAMLGVELCSAGRAFKDVIFAQVTAALASGGARDEQIRLQRGSVLLK